MNGLLVIDKPRGPTSRDAVNRVQRLLPRGAKVGHTGTLDPLATGVLVVCVGSATRLAEYVQAMGKAYRTTVLLGATSDTDDADGTVTPAEGATPPGREAVEAEVRRFVGTIGQVPPAFSAMKVAGRRAHELARGGESVALAARPVSVSSIDVLRYEWPRLELDVRCGKGTYIRSLARDLGAALGCGGLVEELRRTRVGPFRAEDGVDPDRADVAAVAAKLLPVELAVADLPRVEVTPEEAGRLRQGQAVRGDFGPSAAEAAAFEEGRLVGVVAVRDGAARPAKMVG